jgi:hypothetical protein
VSKQFRSQRGSRIVFAFISLFLIALGVGTLLNHRMEYANYWGGMVFAPFVILIGLGLLFVVLFRYDAMLETDRKKHSRIRGWPTRRARDE